VKASGIAEAGACLIRIYLMQGDYMARASTLNTRVEAEMTLQKMDSGEQRICTAAVDEAAAQALSVWEIQAITEPRR